LSTLVNLPLAGVSAKMGIAASQPLTINMTKIGSSITQRKVHQAGKQALSKAVVAAENEALGNLSAATAARQRFGQLLSRSGAAGTDGSLSLAERAARRKQMQHERQQANLERIMSLAEEYCSVQLPQQDIEPDWFNQYCELVLDISNASMQQLWAKILAGELAAPGRFALKTLLTLKQMSVREAVALQHAAALSCRLRSEQAARIYFGYSRKPSLWHWLTGRQLALLNLSQFQLSYPQILSLIDIGILHSSEIESGELQNGQRLHWQIQQQVLNGSVKQAGVVLQYYKYTPTGAELLPLIQCQPHQHYINALQQLLAPVVQFGDLG